jgi:F-type H+-transporting ATPase subunit a
VHVPGPEEVLVGQVQEVGGAKQFHPIELNQLDGEDDGDGPERECAENAVAQGLLPLALVPGWHAFTPTSHFSITGVLAIVSFSIVIIVGFWRHGLHFLSLFLPAGTPIWMAPLIIPIEIISFLVRPFSLALRLFVAMMAGHILMEVFGSFIVNGLASGSVLGFGVGIVSFLFIVGVGALELLICALQAYVFALLTSLYLSDAINLH